MSRILVAYYSMTGHTQQIATQIAAALDADCDTIREVTPRTGALRDPRSALEGLLGRSAAIEPPMRDPAAYDLVIVGTPVWAARMSSPMRTYLTQHRARFKQLAVFCTAGGLGPRGVLRRMAALSEQTAVARLVVLARELESGGYAGKVAQFVDQVQQITP